MSEKTVSPPAPDWSEFQRKYWEAWAEVGQRLADSLLPKPDANPWADALDHWGKAVVEAAPSEVSDFVAKLIDQSKTFFRLAGELSRSLETASTSGESMLDWPEHIAQAMAGWKQALAGSGTDAHKLMRQVMAFWEMPLDTWQRTASSLSTMPGDFLQHLKEEQLGEQPTTLEEGIGRFLSVPGVGYTREWQEQIQTHGRLLLEYQRSYQQYAAGFARFGLQCVEQFEAVLKKRAEEGNVIGSTRELYDLWVDCCEAAYARYVSTEEYSELHGRLVNSLMALKHHSTILIDEALGAMNMPTQREIDTLHKCFQDMHRQGKAVQVELEHLREQVERLTGSSDVSASTAPSAAPAVRPKKPKRVQSAPPTTGRGAARGG